MIGFDSHVRYGLGVPNEETRESMYREWCAKNSLDPEDPKTAIAYEGGWSDAMYPEVDDD